MCVFYLVRINPFDELKAGAPSGASGSSDEIARAQHSPPAGVLERTRRAERERTSAVERVKPGPVYVPDPPRQAARRTTARAREEEAVVEVGSPELPDMDTALPEVGRSRETMDVVRTTDSFKIPRTEGADADTAEVTREEAPAIERPIVRATASSRTYTVVTGDTLMDISKKAFGTVRYWKKIQAANPERFRGGSTTVGVGWKLKIPAVETAGASSVAGSSTEPAAGRTPSSVTARVVHVVQPKENLAAIARRYYNDGGKWRVIWDANKAKLPNPNVIRVGMELKIPRES